MSLTIKITMDIKKYPSYSQVIELIAFGKEKQKYIRENRSKMAENYIFLMVCMPNGACCVETG